MEKWIPYAKMSKKKQREWNAGRRKTWGALSPVTRKAENPKAYNRKRIRQEEKDFPDVGSAVFCG